MRAGEWDTQRTNEPLPTQNRVVREVVIHEQYYSGALFNDVALLFLDTAVDLAPNVGMVCLPEQDESMDNRQCVASGWGKDVFGRFYSRITSRAWWYGIVRLQSSSVQFGPHSHHIQFVNHLTVMLG